MLSYQKTVTDAAPVAITCQSPNGCVAVRIFEDPTAAGWPHNYTVIGNLGGSTATPVLKSYETLVPGPFLNGVVVCTIELVSGGGLTTSMNIQEISSWQ